MPKSDFLPEGRGIVKPIPEDVAEEIEDSDLLPENPYKPRGLSGTCVPHVDSDGVASLACFEQPTEPPEEK
ncbi:MAG: hypothetical protein ISR99_02045 [Parcubacteria group bacterium]|nr:hypothetical protein [Parcubacteria group bacterium]